MTLSSLIYRGFRFLIVINYGLIMMHY